MTIYRYDGDRRLQFDLTSSELKDAYFEQQHEWDMEYIVNGLIDIFNDTGEYDEMQKMLERNPKLLDRVAYRYREYIEDLYGCDDEFDCLKAAVDYCMEEAS